ncbi:MAG: hypothetical protein WDW38_005013 [Sanguina aurantia]
MLLKLCHLTIVGSGQAPGNGGIGSSPPCIVKRSWGTWHPCSSRRGREVEHLHCPAQWFKQRVLNAARVAALTGPRRWAAAIQLAVQASDPWSDRQIHLIPMERAVRHRFNPDTSTWVLDDVLVRMERLPFAAGAMRECFATKKISTMGGSVFHDWKKAQNCVTKRYKKDSVKRAFYFTDTLVQMDAKMLGEEYNRTGPPKKVDFIQPSILEFPQREGSPVMSMEQLIEGPYLKYNSNSGFVLADDLLRHTPQAFSHFSFDVTKGQKICVDVQGVGDLYTDPQIHTLDGHGYGEGNLGLRGMALFFRAHECNALCQRLDLPQFSRCPTDVASQGYVSESSTSAQRPSSHTSVRQGRSGRSSGTSVRRRLHEQQRLTRLAAPATGLQQLRGAAAAAPASGGRHVRAVLLGQSAGGQGSAVENQALAHVHLETARLYGEVVLLPELRPQEDPVQAVSGGLFHLQLAATSGCALAAAVLARAHLGVQASAAQLAALIKAATLSGQFVLHPEMAFHYTHVVAAAGVAQAACALGHAYATGTGIAEGVLGAPDVGQAVAWYRKALSLLDARDLGIAAAARLEGEPGAREDSLVRGHTLHSQQPATAATHACQRSRTPPPWRHSSACASTLGPTTTTTATTAAAAADGPHRCHTSPPRAAGGASAVRSDSAPSAPVVRPLTTVAVSSSSAQIEAAIVGVSPSPAHILTSSGGGSGSGGSSSGPILSVLGGAAEGRPLDTSGGGGGSGGGSGGGAAADSAGVGQHHNGPAAAAGDHGAGQGAESAPALTGVPAGEGPVQVQTAPAVSKQRAITASAPAVVGGSACVAENSTATSTATVTAPSVGAHGAGVSSCAAGVVAQQPHALSPTPPCSDAASASAGLQQDALPQKRVSSGSSSSSSCSAALTSPTEPDLGSVARSVSRTAAEPLQPSTSLSNVTLQPFSLFMSLEFREDYIELLGEEVGILPGVALHRHEMQSALAALLLSGGDGLDPDAAAACQLFNDAAECAMELGKGKLAQNLYERAAEAEALLDSSP